MFWTRTTIARAKTNGVARRPRRASSIPLHHRCHVKQTETDVLASCRSSSASLPLPCRSPAEHGKQAHCSARPSPELFFTASNPRRFLHRCPLRHLCSPGCIRAAQTQRVPWLRIVIIHSLFGSGRGRGGSIGGACRERARSSGCYRTPPSWRSLSASDAPRHPAPAQ